jgi:hypothetical protein
MPRLIALVAFAVGVFASPVFAQPKAECVTRNGQAVCGYACHTAYGQTKCADFPGASCTAAYGQIACGFSCVAAYGELRCARTPGGVCQSHAGRIVCFEPASTGVPPGTHVQQATCAVAAGVLTCGYHCVTAAGTTKCANTPAGACGSVAGTITCNDPPSHLAFLPQTTRMECLSAAGTMACGYSCRAASGEVRCAATPSGTCAVAAGAVTCYDPPAP